MALKVLVYGINFTPELTGIGKYTGELASQLVRWDKQVRMITTPPYYPHWSVSPPYSAWRYQKENLDGIDVFRCPLYVPRKATGLKRIIHLLSFAIFSFPVVMAQVFWKPDVVIVIAPSIFTAPFGLLAGKLAGSKTWIHIQDFEFDAAFDLGIVKSNSLMRKIVMNLEGLLLKGFDCASTISNKMAERLAQKGVQPEKIYLFPNWADTEKIFPQNGPNQLKQELGVPEEKTIILYSGNMGRKQGVEILVAAADKLQDQEDLQFVLCGDGVAKDELIQQARGIKNITFLPLQPVERLNDLLNMADIHVLPQKPNAADLVMPSKLTGMLASGRPVIATALPETELYSVVSKVGITVPPDDPQLLASTILALAHNSDQRKSFGIAGRSFVEENWSRNSVIQGFIRKVESLVNPI